MAPGPPPLSIGAQVHGFHGAGAAAAQHQLALFGEALADVDDLVIARIGALHRMAAHHGHDVLLVVVGDEAVDRVLDGMVVQQAAERFLDVAGLLAHRHITVVDDGVVAGVVGFVITGLVVQVEGLGVVELVGENLVGHLHAGQDDAGFVHGEIHPGRDDAAHEETVLEAVVLERETAFLEIDGLEGDVPQGLVVGHQLTEVVQFFDFSVILSHIAQIINTFSLFTVVAKT